MYRMLDGVHAKLRKYFAKKLNFENDKDLPKWSKKIIHWIIFKGSKIMNGIIIFMGSMWIFNKIYTKYGIERVIILIGLIIIFTLRGISEKLQKPTEPEKAPKPTNPSKS